MWKKWFIYIFIIRPKSRGNFRIFIGLLLWCLIPVIFQISLSACKFSVCVILSLYQYSPIIIFYEYVQIKHTNVVYHGPLHQSTTLVTYYNYVQTNRIQYFIQFCVLYHHFTMTKLGYVHIHHIIVFTKNKLSYWL